MKKPTQTPLLLVMLVKPGYAKIMRSAQHPAFRALERHVQERLGERATEVLELACLVMLQHSSSPLVLPERVSVFPASQREPTSFSARLAVFQCSCFSTRPDTDFGSPPETERYS